MVYRHQNRFMLVHSIAKPTPSSTTSTFYQATFAIPLVDTPVEELSFSLQGLYPDDLGGCAHRLCYKIIDRLFGLRLVYDNDLPFFVHPVTLST